MPHLTLKANISLSSEKRRDVLILYSSLLVASETITCDCRVVPVPVPIDRDRDDQKDYDLTRVHDRIQTIETAV